MHLNVIIIILIYYDIFTYYYYHMIIVYKQGFVGLDNIIDFSMLVVYVFGTSQFSMG